MEAFELGFDSRVFAPIRPSQLLEYREAWMYFQTVGKYNYSVQQERIAGAAAQQPAQISYFRFPSNDDQQRYNLGLRLYLKQFPEFASNLSAIVPLEL
jgi:hypothetical protein